MTEEDAFIRAIQTHPDDAASKLVYADWLDERGESARAEYLRSWAQSGYWPNPHFGLVGRSWRELIHSQEFVWDAATLLALGRLQGLVCGYACVNDHRSDISYDFQATLVRPQGALDAQVTAWFPEAHRPVSRSPLTSWKDDLRTLLARWMFDSLRTLPTGPIRLAFQDETRRDDLVTVLLAAIEDVIRPRRGWRLQITETQFYAIEWDDLVLEADDRLLFLHFSLSD
jgi:uncharacterized protein (TIGR02996 family)